MTEEKRKQLAPTVVLASHGNKKACRELYIHYHKDVFFICYSMTADFTKASELTVAVFEKMFRSLERLDDHNDFQQWLFSLTINICRSHVAEPIGGITNKETESLAAAAAGHIKKGDKKAFERTVMQIIENMVQCLPSVARVILLYRYYAQLDAGQIALLEKLEEDEALTRITAVDMLIDRQCEKIKKSGVDMKLFTKDLHKALSFIASKKFIPDNVHKDLSEKTGIDMSPYAKEKEKKKEAPPEKKKTEKKDPEPPAKEKKLRFTAGDFILFFGIIAAVLVIFSVSGHFFSKKEAEQTTLSQSSAEKPVLLWNGAAASTFDGGSGTPEDPFQIATGTQLAYLANLVNEGDSYYAACSYILTADILLNETDNFDTWQTSPPDNKWTPIGSSADDDSHAYFTGTFDGNGHTIEGLYVTGNNDYSGLFGVSRNALFTDITITKAYIDGGSYTGGITGYYAADTKEVSGFRFCSFSGVVLADGNNAGGITGYFRAEGEMNSTFITECCVSGHISAAKGYAGGISGVSEADTGSVMIKNCFSTARIHAGRNAGGITGDSRAADGAAIIDCCYNAGIISASQNAGGISGIINCAEGEGKVNIQACIILEASSPVGVTRGTGGERLVVDSIAVFSASEMILKDNFDRFNFEDTWKITGENGYRYPVLKNTDYIPLTANIFEEHST